MGGSTTILLLEVAFDCCCCPHSPNAYTSSLLIGGVSGSIVASRLSENPDVSVLLVERGANLDSWRSHIPLLSAELPASASPPTNSWLSSSLNPANPEGHAILTGKALGGTSSINSLVHHWPTPGEWDSLSKTGMAGWSWRDVGPFFRRNETALGHRDADTSHRGGDGPWKNRRLGHIQSPFAKQ
jgi:choline dehydrogenase-like flavoprotein